MADRAGVRFPMRTDIRFHAGDVTLAGWLYRPAGAGPHPLVVLSHGFSVLMAMGLDRYAEVFARAGLACLVYEHRNFGASEGTPRHEIDPWQQIADMRDAISHARTLPAIDKDRIGLWGTSYSGGHALVVAALDRGVKCVVSQVPLVAGEETLRTWVGEGAWASVQERFVADRDARCRGEAPRTTRPARTGSQTWDWVEASGTATIYPNEITLRSLELLGGYEPCDYIARVAPTPLLMVLATQDTQTPYAGQLAAFERAGEPKRLVQLDGGHYDVYTKLFDAASGAARDWFVQHLRPT